MAASRGKRQLSPESLQQVADLDFLIHWDAEVVVEAREHALEGLKKTLKVLDFRAERYHPDFSIERIEEFYGKFTSHHALATEPLDWGLKLTEPQATKALAHLLNRGTDEEREQRISNFLQALGTPDLKCTKGIMAYAEVATNKRGRIDLAFGGPPSGGQRNIQWLALIEAKFGYRISGGQLSEYYQSTKRAQAGRCDYVLLSQNDSDWNKVRGKQKDIWRLVTWSNLWRRFEARRGQENDHQLQLFMSTLWRRIHQR